MAGLRLLAAFWACALPVPCRCEAPAGAVPSSGAVSWFADYELRFSPESIGEPALQMSLPAWHYQHEIGAFYTWRASCTDRCPPPPLNTALFVLSLPQSFQEQMLEECPGLLIASFLLVAEARIYSDAMSARQLFALAEGLRGSYAAPGWSVNGAASWVERTNSTIAHVRLLHEDCEAADVDVVVAHCDEKLDWLGALRGARIWVYHKCGPRPMPADVPCVTAELLPNLAMESLAYATHMARRHGAFARFTLFLQGSPFEHMPRLLFENVLGSLQSGTYDIPFLHLNSRRFLSGNSICLSDLYQRLFEGQDVPEVFGSYCCSQFVVRSDRLMLRSRELYERVISFLIGTLPLLCQQDVGYDARPRIAVSALFEHLWHVVLGEDPVLPPRHGDFRLPVFARMDTLPTGLPAQFQTPVAK